MNDFVVYGHKGSGSVPIEATLVLLGLGYDTIEPASIGAEAMAAVNPMQQIPALRLPNGEVMTETGAILLYLADNYRPAGLAPALDSRERGAFLRWLFFVSSQIHALVWARDVPARLAARGGDEKIILARTADRIAHCWAVMDRQIQCGLYSLGDTLSVLDLYVTVASCWGPRRARFKQVAPRLAEAVKRVETDQRLARLWAERLW